MRFIITAQSSAENTTADPQQDLPPEILQRINEAAPAWSAAAWQSRNA